MAKTIFNVCWISIQGCSVEDWDTVLKHSIMSLLGHSPTSGKKDTIWYGLYTLNTSNKIKWFVCIKIEGLKSKLYKMRFAALNIWENYTFIKLVSYCKKLKIWTIDCVKIVKDKINECMEMPDLFMKLMKRDLAYNASHIFVLIRRY